MNARVPIEAAQGTPQWHAARRGHLTGSRMADVLAVLKNGKPAQARTDYLMEVVNERLTGIAETRFVTQAMQDGIDREPLARAEYEIVTGRDVRDAGFILHPTIEFFGATPDGLVGPDGALEVKAPTRKTYLRWLTEGIVPPEYVPQMIAEAVCADRAWVDFVAYHPDFGQRKLFVRRFTPSNEERERVEAEARKFLADVEDMFDRVLTTEMIG
jgi:predicted phage-related endonuclease